MPSTATTTVTIGAALDLIGPATASSTAFDDQPAFDSLLQSSATPTTTSAAPASASSEKSPSSYTAENSNRLENVDQHGSSPPHSSADDNGNESPGDACIETSPDSPPKVAQTTAQLSEPEDESPETDSPETDQPPKAAEPVVVESLAGLAAASPTTAPPRKLAVEAESPNTNETEPVATKTATADQGATSQPAAEQKSATKMSSNDAKVKQEQALSFERADAQNRTRPAAVVQPSGIPGTTESANAESAQIPNAPRAIQVAAEGLHTASSNTTELVKSSTTESVAGTSAPSPSTPSAIQVAAEALPAAKTAATEPATSEKVAAQAAMKSNGVKPNAVNSDTAKSSTTKSNTAKSNSLKSDAENSDALKSFDEPAELSDETDESAAEGQKEGPSPPNKQHQSLSNEIQPSPPLDQLSTPLSVPSADSGISATTSTPPPVAAVRVTPPTIDPGPDSKAAPDTNQATTIALPPRPRLPAELLAQSINGPTRRAAAPIDATRLLVRVARAFAAAQERDSEIRLRLSPPDLGSLRLEVRVQDGALVARLQTETDAARTAIIDNLPALRDRLAQQGVRIERFDVDLMQRQPGGMPDQPGGRQQPELPAQVRALAPPRRQTSAPITSAPTLPTINSADGLNVVV